MVSSCGQLLPPLEPTIGLASLQSDFFYVCGKIRSMKKRIISIALIVISLLILLPVIYLSRPGASAQAGAAAAMQSSLIVQVTDDQWILFEPIEMEPTLGFIFYPGGRVEEDAYAPILHEIASQGYLVVNVPMPFDLAVFGSRKADKVIAAYPEISTWVIGGHSLGGVMACEYASENLDTIDAVALWASYPAESTVLADSGLQVISISASLDGLSTPDKILNSAARLPVDTIWVEIAGGNHAQFGDYGRQTGDYPSEISHEEQYKQTVDAMVEFFESLTE